MSSDARTEAERRWPSPNSGFYEGLIEGFVLGAAWVRDKEMVRLNAAEALRKNLDPQPWLFISDQIFGEIRWHEDKGYHDVSGTYWVFSPRPGYEQDRSMYLTKRSR